MIKWHLEKRKIKDLKPYSKNPRQLTKDQEAHLTVSLDKFGIIDHPFINLDNTIIGGHQRIHVLKKLGFKEIDVNVPERMLADKEVEEINLRHNKNTGEFDFDCLANMWEVEDLLKWGFTEGELGGLAVMPEEVEEKEEKGGKAKKCCPKCGHEF
jgi:ParB-like chromosome segregation protein Spo0J